jgi:hypothetical protein
MRDDFLLRMELRVYLYLLCGLSIQLIVFDLASLYMDSLPVPLCADGTLFIELAMPFHYLCLLAFVPSRLDESGLTLTR